MSVEKDRGGETGWARERKKGRSFGKKVGIVSGKVERGRGSKVGL